MRSFELIERTGQVVVHFAEVCSRSGFFLLSREPRPSFRWGDLVGKTVLGFAEAPTPWQCMLTVLRKNGVDPAGVAHRARAARRPGGGRVPRRPRRLPRADAADRRDAHRGGRRPPRGVDGRGHGAGALHLVHDDAGLPEAGAGGAAPLHAGRLSHPALARHALCRRHRGGHRAGLLRDRRVDARAHRRALRRAGHLGTRSAAAPAGITTTWRRSCAPAGSSRGATATRIWSTRRAPSARWRLRRRDDAGLGERGDARGRRRRAGRRARSACARRCGTRPGRAGGRARRRCGTGSR